MAGTMRTVVAGLIAVTVLGTGKPAAAQTLKLTLRVQNQANVATNMLAAAESKVAAIYANAGIDIAFVHDGGAADLIVVLVSPDDEERMRPNADALGFAPCSELERGQRAYVLQGRVDKVAEGYSAVRYIVLAVAIAHEVGHLLLPPNAHSKMGIMKARLGQREFYAARQGHLLFTPEQIAQIHSRLTGETLQVAAR